MQPIIEALSRVNLGEPQQFQNLTVFPLLSALKKAPDYRLLDEALTKGFAHVSEVSENGSVPELMFVNDSPEKVLLIDGEELVGARQNRILNVTILVGGRQKVVIPVSCVEQGRWSYKSRRFASSDSMLFATARAKKMYHVNASMRERRSRYANQTEIWSDISLKAERLRAFSDTDSMSDIYQQQAARVDEFVKAFTPESGQAGAVFAINDRVIGMELFDSEDTFRRFMAKLVRGYAMDAIEHIQPDAKRPVAELVQRFLEDMKSAAVQRFPALAEGEDIRIESDTVAGGALYVGNRVVHLCAFQAEKPAGRAIPRGGNIDFEIPAFLRRTRARG